jgi:hypothetical protein
MSFDSILKEVRAGDNDCWLWNKSVRKDGYGTFYANGKQNYAHRFSYEFFIGAIPQGLHLDHLCRVRNCVNPKHLEPVTQWENTHRAALANEKKNCPQGHPFDEINTYLYRGGKKCKICKLASTRKWRAKK